MGQDSGRKRKIEARVLSTFDTKRTVKNKRKYIRRGECHEIKQHNVWSVKITNPLSGMSKLRSHMFQGLIEQISPF